MNFGLERFALLAWYFTLFEMLFASGEPYYIWHAALIYLLARFRWRSRVHIMMHLFYPCKRHTFTRKKRGDLYRITNGTFFIKSWMKVRQNGRGSVRHDFITVTVWTPFFFVSSSSIATIFIGYLIYDLILNYFSFMGQVWWVDSSDYRFVICFEAADLCFVLMQEADLSVLIS